MSHLKLHFALHTSHCTFTLHTSHFTLHTPHFTLHSSHSTLHTSHSTLHTSHCTLHTPHFTLHTPHFTLHTSHFSLLHTPHFTLLTSHFFTLHTSHCTLHTPHFISSELFSPYPSSSLLISSLLICHLSFHESLPSTTSRTCMRRVPARPVRACFVRSCCSVVGQEHNLPQQFRKFRKPNLLTNHCRSLDAATPILFTRSSCNRSTHEVPFIAGCSHFTRKNTRFRAPPPPQNKAHATFHAGITMRFAASRRKPARIYAHSNKACNIHAAIPMRSAKDTVKLRATASDIAAPKPDLDANAQKRQFSSTFSQGLLKGKF